MKHENFLKLLTLRDRIKLDTAPKITNKSMLKDEIKNTIDEALKYLDNRTSSLWTSYYMENFLEWFCSNCLGGQVEPSQLSHKQKNEIFKDVGYYGAIKTLPKRSAWHKNACHGHTPRARRRHVTTGPTW